MLVWFALLSAEKQSVKPLKFAASDHLTERRGLGGHPAGHQNREIGGDAKGHSELAGFRRATVGKKYRNDHLSVDVGANPTDGDLPLKGPDFAAPGDAPATAA